MSKRLFVFISLLVTTFFALTVFINPSVSRAKLNSIDPAFRDYVSAFSSGYISNESPIRIVLKQDAALPEDLNPDDLISFSPEIKGKASWVGKNVFEFKPDEILPHGAKYSAAFSLGKVLSVPNELETFEFSFATVPQALEAEIVSVHTSNSNEYVVNGLLTFADAESNDNAEKCLSVNFISQNMNVEWVHDSPLEHRFIVKNVKRSAKEEVLNVYWNGEACQSSSTGQTSLFIPAIGVFKPIMIRPSNESEQNVAVYFSENLSNNEGIEPFVKLENEDISLTKSDNELRVYPQSRINGTKTLSLEPGLSSENQKKLTENFTFPVVFEDLKPEIRLHAKGNIIPPGNKFLFPFEAVNLNAVDVKIVRIYENNILQFLQVNNLSNASELARVGKQIIKKKILLSSLGSNARNRWNTFYLDLNQIIQTEPGAIYNVSLNFKPSYSTYACNSDSTNISLVENIEEEENEKEWDAYSYYYEGDYDYYYDDYDYRERENPCSKSYYGPSRKVDQNILASDIGLIVKRTGNGQLLVVTNSITDAKAMSSVSIECYDFQQQLMHQTQTGGDGMAFIQLEKKPFVIVAKKGAERAYLKLDDGNTNSLSMFDVDGDIIQKGMKGFIYGERGVWRPGDSLFISFMLENKDKEIPSDLPASLELNGPSGQTLVKSVRSKNINGLYTFPIKTDAYAPTGLYSCVIRSGGVSFSKSIRVESIMPNRLKIDLNFGTDKILAGNGNIDAKLQVNWLHGAPARNLETKIDLSLNPVKTEFKGYKEFKFDNPAASFYSEPSEIFNSQTDETGFVNVKASLSNLKNAPGFLNAGFTTRVFEPGGAFSTDRFSLPLSPYSYYVGLRSPKIPKDKSYLETDTDHRFQIVTLNETGQSVNRKVKIKVYKVSWRWWWDNYNDDLSTYAGSEYHQPVFNTEIETEDGKGSFVFRINQPDWGRFLILAEDENGHTTGDVIYMDWPSWAGKSPKGNEGANFLNFSADKEEYNTGDKINLLIPGAEGARAFISVENGSGILQTFWMNLKAGDNAFSFEADERMTPNIYVYATVIQPHANTANDLPIRLYGLVNLKIKDEKTILNPVIETGNVWQPLSEVKVKISEKDGKKMAYTLAIVDEGLLDITRFKTPDPWSSFYAKEALGVKTWDVYDFVMNALAAGIQRILSIGGDGDIDTKNGSNAQRFKPMVRFVGPVLLEKGETNEHVIQIPQYVGSVRIMAVASQSGAYGKSEKAVPVRKPLMILSTLPRVLGPSEELVLPVSVFAMEKGVRDVQVKVTTDKFISTPEENVKSVEFERVGDKVVNFKLKVNDAIGVSRVTIQAVSGGEIAKEEIEIEVRPSNALSNDVIAYQVGEGQSVSINYQPYGLKGTNQASLEISSMPPLNLKKRLRYLISYPHGCVEQTTSAAFAQLCLPQILDISEPQRGQIDKNIKAAIQRLSLFVTASGGLSYWPGLNTADEWGTNYAFHFLTEASKRGFVVPQGLMQNIKRFQKDKSRQWKWSRNSVLYQEDVTQSYRLYTLALNGSPDLGSMNKLKEANNLSNVARWKLAAAYAISGQKDVAKKLIAKQAVKTPYYSYSWYSYGSSFRDDAMILETLIAIDDQSRAFQKLQDLSSTFSSEEWLSTQSTAYGILAISKFVSKNELSKGLSFDLYADKKISIKKQGSVYLHEIANAGKNSALKIKNNNKGILFVRLTREGIPPMGTETDAAHDLLMDVKYTDRNHKAINIESITQGSDFYALVTITNPGYRDVKKNLALSQIFPSGWEIHNNRLDENADQGYKIDVPSYSDVRDDRVYTYFDLAAGSSKTFRVQLNAAYLGKYYLPGISCEAMYDNTVYARKAGKWVEVVSSEKESL